jgi:acetyl-CoA synthetase
MGSCATPPLLWPDIGLPDPVRGQSVTAFVVLKLGFEPDAAALQDFVRRRLATYEYPRSIEFVPDLPLTTTGKIRRTELRAGYAEASPPSGTP